MQCNLSLVEGLNSSWTRDEARLNQLSFTCPRAARLSLQALAESCMLPSPEARPIFSAILEDLSTLRQAEQAGDAEPHEAFAVYQDWGACGPASSMSPEAEQ